MVDPFSARAVAAAYDAAADLYFDSFGELTGEPVQQRFEGGRVDGVVGEESPVPGQDGSTGDGGEDALAGADVEAVGLRHRDASVCGAYDDGLAEGCSEERSAAATRALD